MDHIDITARRGTLIVHGSRPWGGDGILTATGPYHVWQDDGDAERLGRVVMDLFAEQGDELSDDPKDVMRRMLRAVGLSSNSTFMRGARYASVDRSEAGVRVVAWENAGARKGFIPVQDSEVSLAASVDGATLGQSVYDALSAAEDATPAWR